MKQANMKKLFIIGALMLSVPTFLFAQQDEKKENTEIRERKEVKERKEMKEKVKDKKGMETIVITRRADDNDKTVIEINGDKVKINGKEADENKDVHVNIHKRTGANVYSFNNGNTFDFNTDNMQLFSEDQNRAMLGVVTEENDKGAEIQSISKESAAEKAGLKKGDIITKIGDEKIDNTEDVTNVIRDHKPGDKVTIEILRDGKGQTITAELGKWKGINMNNIYMPRKLELDQRMGELNGRLDDMNQGHGDNWNITPMPPMTYNFNYGGRPKLGLSIQDTDDGNGVKVLDVDEESNAAKAGIEENDIITRIDDKDIKSTEDVTNTMKAAGKDKYSYTFNILRDGKKMVLDVKVPRKLKTADL